MQNCNVRLKRGKEKLPKNHHPWIFSGAIESIDGEWVPGEIAAVFSAQNEFIGYGHMAKPGVSIAIRLFSWTEEAIDSDFWRTRLVQAGNLRRPILQAGTNACRWIHSESDFCPGLIVDRYADVFVLQANTLGFDKIKADIARLLLECNPEIKTVYEKSDSEGRKMEQLPESIGHLMGEKLPHLKCEICEDHLFYEVDLDSQKTGFYTDQRENRMRVESWVRPGMRVVDICAYTGAFALHALRAGAEHVTLIDASQEALATAQKNIERNGFSLSQIDCIKGNMFDVVRRLEREKHRFDFAVLDPPKLIRNAHQLHHAEKSYKDLNMNTIRLLNPESFLATFSCSGNLSAEGLQTQLAYAAKDTARAVQILAPLAQGSDHPVLTTVPESFYLKGFIARVI